ncbi:MAG: alanine--tRNA ligase [Gammaproteobacteria bacterium]|nr:MAG: alanine--tRNA ligase [Gammaproteobacteria bacterium]RLA52040.1 MAG: alanine--tRNA ligase [Gammaproteobacteria bacterium]
MKSTADIRDSFLSYFVSQGHTAVASSSLVPGNDPTLLFTNAGMVQFKDAFLGVEQRDYLRAVSSQRCVRAGGKHNDLENVGFTARHHTFFEMLGNFSFGDYFKREAIQFAWQFLTEVLGLPEERLWVTVHISDDETADIWLQEMGVSAARFSRLDEDNFWQMGDTGPCGPCSEIFYDHGEDVPGGPPGSEGEELDRYIEIWNLVFMQYERSIDGTLTPLPKPSIDTGMGLERIAAVMQGVHSNYEIDIFSKLIEAVAEITQTEDLANQSLRVIADHIRSCSFLIVDGVLPANEGRGYVLRRIIRRALRHGHKLGVNTPFFYQLVKALVGEMGETYPELEEKQELVEQALRDEEVQFAKTLDRGLAVLEGSLADLDGAVIPGALIFQLYDTYGFPVDLTNDIARERDYSLDLDGYERCMTEQRERARAASRFDIDYGTKLEIPGATTFTGYQSLQDKARVTALYRDGAVADKLVAGDTAIVVLDQTTCYGESGGQVGDQGQLLGETARFAVNDCKKQGSNHLHIGRLLDGELAVGDVVTVEVKPETRTATALNHSATHLLQAALREILCEQVTQKGSLVDAQRLRFDFTHAQALTAEQIAAVEAVVNEQIRLNSIVQTEEMSMAAAQEKGAMALFGEKYGDSVRVLTMGDGFSIELCGGTHAHRTGDIGLIKIISETGIAAGIRRIEALTGVAALAYYRDIEDQLQEVASVLKTQRMNMVDKASQLVKDNRRLERELETLKVKLASSSGGDILGDAQTIGDISVLAKIIEGADVKSLRDMADQLKSRLDKGVVLLAAVSEGKVLIIAGVTKNITSQIRAGDLMKFIAEQVGGKGGGRSDMAQGGGTDVNALPAAIESVGLWVREQISS